MNKQDRQIQPIPGVIYQHYKGGLYEAMYVATHTTTGEKMVIYKSHTEGTIYARPLKEWDEDVVIDKEVSNFSTVKIKFVKNGGITPRFKIFELQNNHWNESLKKR